MFKKSTLSPAQYQNMVANPKPGLKLLQIIPSLLCDARCKHCHIWGTQGWALSESKSNVKEQLDIEILKQFIDDALIFNNNKSFWVLITGGEALLYKDIFALIDFLKSRQLPIILLSNGSQLKDISEYIVDSVSSISISLDGPELIHDKIRNKKNLYKDACESILKIIDVKERKKTLFPGLTINCTVSQFNVPYIKEFIETFEAFLSAHNIHISYDLNALSKSRDIAVNFGPLLFTKTESGLAYEKQLRQYLNVDASSSWKSFISDTFDMDVKFIKKYLQDLWKKHGVECNDFVDLEEYFLNYNNTFGRTRCQNPWRTLMIRQNGDAYFCPDLKDYCIGNIYKSSFSEIWEGKKALDFRNHLSNHLFPVCNRCCGLFIDYNFPVLKRSVSGSLSNNY
jgi:Fe-coproporphyrin III synthase